MPGFNGTGPMGQGAMTGRGLGRCANTSVNANENASKPEVIEEQDIPAFGNRGNGMGFGRQARFGGRR